MMTRRRGALLWALLLAGSSPASALVAPVRLDVPGLRSSVPGLSPRAGGVFSAGPGLSPWNLAAPGLSGTLGLPKTVVPTVRETVFAPAPQLSFGVAVPKGSAVAGLNLLTRGLQGAAGRVFDGAFRLDGGEGSSAGRRSPKLPPGAVGVSVDVVRTAEDVDRLIPSGKNSNKFKAKLKKAIGEVAPFFVHTYRDALGGTMVALDLGSKPELAGLIPELQRHEVALIKKIQVWNRDLQVLVREAGKTPDLIVGGLVTELKTQMGDYSLISLVDKANEQVREHGQRHGLGPGAVAVDLFGEDKVDVETVQKKLSDWGRSQKDHALNKVFAFWDDELRVFVRRPDGSFSLGQPGIPFQRGGAPLQGGWGPRGIPTAAFKPPRGLDLSRVVAEDDARRLTQMIKKLVNRGRSREADELWRRFAAAHQGPAVQAAWNEVSFYLSLP